ncbi:MAG: polymerase sigma-70 factor, subfamily [Chloroflexota bacterium]|nr:polymerase sigma-70 factor, subfamily [Chloroflexota bacterium]
MVHPFFGGSVTSVPPDPQPGLRTDQPAAIDERAAVDAVLAGDRDAFRILVDRESAAVIRACHRILGDLHEAEDAAQEAFVIAFRGLAGWRADGPFGAWLTRIAIRISLRRAQTRRDGAWIDPTDPERPLHVPGGIDPASSSLRSERATEVRAAVARLDEPYRETVALRFFGELSLDEIATQTGRPLGTVKTHLHRGLIRLRGAIDGTAP